MYPVGVLIFSLFRFFCIKTKEMNIIGYCKTEVFENRMLRYDRFKKNRRDRFLNLSDSP